MLEALTKKDDYAPFKQKFDKLAQLYSILGNSDFDEDLYFQRFLPYLDQASTENAYKLLAYLYLVHAHHTIATNIRPSFKLLGECVIHLKPLLSVMPESFLECESEAIVALPKDVPDNLISKVTTEAALSKLAEKGLSFPDLIAKKLFDANVHRDEAGSFFMLEGVRIAPGQPSSYVSASLIAPIVGPEAFHPAIIYDYADIVRHFYSAPENFNRLSIDFFELEILEILIKFPRQLLFDEQVVESLNRIGAKRFLIICNRDDSFKDLLMSGLSQAKILQFLDNNNTLALIHKSHLKQYGAIIRAIAISPDYIENNYVELNQIFSQNTFLYELQRKNVLFLAFTSLSDHDKKLLLTQAAIQASYAEMTDDSAKHQFIGFIWGYISDCALDCNISFIIDFFITYKKNDLNDFRDYYHQYMNSPEATQLKWFAGVSLPQANQMLTLLKDAGLDIEYQLLFTGSAKLRQASVIKMYAQCHMNLNLPIARVESPMVVPAVQLTRQQEMYCANIQAGIYQFKKIRIKALLALEKYADPYFIKYQGQYYAKNNIPTEHARASALQRLMDVLNTDDSWHTLTRLIADHEFKLQAGCTEDLGLLDRLLIKHPFWDLVVSLQESIARQADFFKAFQDQGMLVKVIATDELFYALTAAEFQEIFHQCDREVLIETLVACDRLKDWLPVETYIAGARVELDAHAIKVMTSTRDDKLVRANRYRDKFNIKSKIPADYEKPGISEIVHHLENELLYQYEQADIATAESYLVEKYRSILINQFDISVSLSEAQASPSPISFYYIPVCIQPIMIDPEKTKHPHYKAFQNFKNNLSSLMVSHAWANPKLPIVFCGVSNLDGVHYVPYFIHLNQAGVVHVITVDPSPQSREWSGAIPALERCLKYKAQVNLKKIFKEIFPGCIYSDPNISQQVRQRDCGPNTLTVLEDALKSARSATPLISIFEGELKIHPERLSVNFNVMRLYNHSNSNYYYNVPLTSEIGRVNRLKWAERLKEQSISQHISANENRLSLKTRFSIVGLEEYSYELNVNKQSNDDDNNETYSIVAIAIGEIGGLHNDIDAIKRNFINNLMLPSNDIIQAWAEKIKTDYPVVLEGLDGNADDLPYIISSVIENNIKDSFREAVINSFEEYAKDYKIGSVYDDYHALITAFVKTSKASAYYTRLSDSDRLVVVERVTPAAKKIYLIKTRDFHQAKVEEFLSEHLLAILLDNRCMVSEFDKASALNSIMKYLQASVVGLHLRCLENMNSSMTFQIEQNIAALIQPYANETLIWLEKIIDSRDSMESINVLAPEQWVSFLSPYMMAMLPNEPVENVISRNQLIVNAQNHHVSATASLIAFEINARLEETFQAKYSSLLSDYVSAVFAKSSASISLDDMCYLLESGNESRLISYVNNIAAPYVIVVDSVNVIKRLIKDIVFEKSKAVLDILLENYQHSAFDLHMLKYYIDKDESIVMVENILNDLMSQSDLLTTAQIDLLRDFFPINRSVNSSADKFFYQHHGNVLANHIKVKNQSIDEVISLIDDYQLFVTRVRAGLTEFSLYSNEPLNSSIDNYITSILDFFTSQQSISQLLYQKSAFDTSAFLQDSKVTIQKHLNDFIHIIYKNYHAGDLAFDGMTARLRQLFCQGFNIQIGGEIDVLPYYFTRAQVVEIDEIIANKIVNLAWGSISYSSVKIHSLPYLKARKTTPAIPLREQFIAPKDLLQAVINWEQFYASAAEYPQLLKDLLNLVIHMPSEIESNTPLPHDWCETHILPLIYGEGSQDPIAQQFIDYLSGFANFVGQKIQPEDAIDIIRFSHLNEILAVYKNNRLNESQNNYLKQVQAPAALTCSEDKVSVFMHQPLVNRLFIAEPALKTFEATLARIKDRHAASAVEMSDFSLDEGDADILRYLLKRRWNELRTINSSPENYMYFKYPLDRIYLWLALTLKQLLKNLGSSVSAYQLLMPDHIIHAVNANNEAKNDADNDDGFEKDIDNYNYKDILTLPDGRWFSLSYLLYEYRSTHLIRKLPNGY